MERNIRCKGKERNFANYSDYHDIVIIILAAISIRTLTTRESAVTAKYVQEFVELKKEVETKRIINSKTRSRECR